MIHPLIDFIFSVKKINIIDLSMASDLINTKNKMLINELGVAVDGLAQIKNKMLIGELGVGVDLLSQAKNKMTLSELGIAIDNLKTKNRFLVNDSGLGVEIETVLKRYSVFVVDDGTADEQIGVFVKLLLNDTGIVEEQIKQITNRLLLIESATAADLVLIKTLIEEIKKEKDKPPLRIALILEEDSRGGYLIG
jgi:hypothetical protein